MGEGVLFVMNGIAKEVKYGCNCSERVNEKKYHSVAASTVVFPAATAALA